MSVSKFVSDSIIEFGFKFEPSEALKINLRRVYEEMK